METVNNQSGTIAPEQDECLFCMLQKEGNRDSHKILSQPLYRDDDFYIKPGKGAIIPGYLMMIPNPHVLSTANLPRETHKKLFRLIDHTRGILEDTFNRPTIFFESGTADGGTKFSNSIIHAHMHTAPIDLSPENDLAMKQQMFLEPFDYRERLPELGHRAYSLLIDAQDRGFAATTLDRPRQIFRKVIAQQIGKNDAWNWREEENRFNDILLETVEKLRPKFRALNRTSFYFDKPNEGKEKTE